MFKITIRKTINPNEVIYIILMMSLIYGLFTTGVQLKTLVVLDGAVTKFISVIVAPIWIHLKCLYYDKSSGYIVGDEERNSEIIMNPCQCHAVYKSKWTMYLETFVLILILLAGFYLLFFILGSVTGIKL